MSIYVVASLALLFHDPKIPGSSIGPKTGKILR